MHEVLSLCLSLVFASLLGTTVLFAEVMKAQRQFSLNLANIRINFNSVRFRKHKVMEARNKHLDSMEEVLDGWPISSFLQIF